MKPTYSHDIRGKLWVACSECNRGANSPYQLKCAGGLNIKRGGDDGCFGGTLLEQFVKPEKEELK
jgi:hypothetical protein